MVLRATQRACLFRVWYTAHPFPLDFEGSASLTQDGAQLAEVDDEDDDASEVAAALAEFQGEDMAMASMSSITGDNGTANDEQAILLPRLIGSCAWPSEKVRRAPAS